MDRWAGEPIGSTVGPEEAARRDWDAAVIGAGPAGALAAALLAQRGLAVVLLERRALPRDKVCGGCVSAAALDVLDGTGMRGAALLGGPRLRRAIIVDQGRLEAPLHGGIALSRAVLDGWLVREAIRRGAHLLSEASAVSTTLRGEWRIVQLRTSSARPAGVRAKAVVLAAGLAGRLGGDAAAVRVRTAQGSRIGVGVTLPAERADAAGLGVAPGEIVMACGRCGYVGMTIIEDGKLHIAAALDPGFIRESGGPGGAVIGILHEAGAPAPDLANAAWRGTPALTRTPSRLSLPRMLLVGDAAGYVEPFTGEGIAWAIGAAVAAAPLVEAGVRAWSAELEQEWARRHRAVVGSRQRLCRAAAWSLRRQPVRRAALRAGRAAPVLVGAVAGCLHHPYNLGGAAGSASVACLSAAPS